mgnify:CR=1 FL=1
MVAGLKKLEEWNWTIDECKHTIVFFGKGTLQ